MNVGPAVPPPLPVPTPAVPPGRTLRRLFLILFLRGRTSRGLRKDSAPKSLGSKLGFTLVIYALVGLVALMLFDQPVFTLSLYLHAMGFVFIGMFIAASAGEILFNKEEGDILLHRPVTPKALLWAKIGVLVQVSLWLMGAFNLVGFFAGSAARDSTWLFLVAHALSITLEALFCTACVVLTYQLCLRWFGRERLDNLMTTAQVFVAVAAVVGGQIVPQIMARFHGNLKLSLHAWWLALLPPAWFAGFDDAIAGTGSAGSWTLGAVGLTASGITLSLAFGKLAREYEAGLHSLSEVTATGPRRAARRRKLEAVVNVPPLRWWLRDPVARASFLLVSAYLVRDRDVKLRVYPGVAPMLVMPFIFLLQDRMRGGSGQGGFGVAFAGAYLGLIPMLTLNLLQYSQQWQAGDLFRAAPMSGPGQLCHGARRAVLCFVTFPLLIVFALAAWLVAGTASQLALFLPGLIALPVYALIPTIGGKAVPLSLPNEEAKATRRGLSMFGVTLISLALGGIALWARSGGWFGWMLIAETLLVTGVYLGLRFSLKSARWPSIE